MVWPWVVPYPAVDFGIRITGPLGAEFPYRPIGVVLVVEEIDESIGGISICSLRKGR